jgi:hypothetical protein
MARPGRLCTDLPFVNRDSEYEYSALQNKVSTNQDTSQIPFRSFSKMRLKESLEQIDA